MPRLPQQDLDHVLAHTGALWDDLRDQQVFLTGGTGFVGRWLLESALWANDERRLGMRVVVLTRNVHPFREQAPHLADHPSVNVRVGDITSFEFPDGAFPFVIHAAVEPHVEPDAARPLGAFDANVDGTRRMLEFARTHGTRRFLFTSSGAAYGPQPSAITHIPEDYVGAPATTDTGSAYGQSKRVAEHLCTMYARAYRFDAVIARLFAFVGPLLPLDANFAVGNFIRDALRGGPVRIAGDGTPHRSYLYAADLAIWLWTLLLRGRSAYAYNVGSADDVSIAELARSVVRVVAADAQIEIAGTPVPGTPPARYVPATTRCETELGLRALVPLTDSLRRTAQWHRDAQVARARNSVASMNAA